MKSVQVRVPYAVWEAAKIKMIADGESFQSLLLRALEDYIKGGEQDAATTNKPKKNS